MGELDKDDKGNLLFRVNNKGETIDNKGRKINDKGYLIDE